MPRKRDAHLRSSTQETAQKCSRSMLRFADNSPGATARHLANCGRKFSAHVLMVRMCLAMQALLALRSDAVAAGQAHKDMLAAARREEAERFQQALAEARTAAAQHVRVHALVYTQMPLRTAVPEVELIRVLRRRPLLPPCPEPSRSPHPSLKCSMRALYSGFCITICPTQAPLSLSLPLRTVLPG